MTGVSGATAHDVQDDRREDGAAGEQPATTSTSASPLPGVMDFVGAHVGGELAEERWR